jgi:phage/plasmid-like protein (TIGR03299 family)
MAHEIGTYDQIAARVTPWHGLGVVTGRHMTSREALELSGLGGWHLTTVPLFAPDLEGGWVEVPGSYAVQRQDTGRVIGVVGDRYEIIPNEELFSFADALVDTGEAWYESAGSLRDNRVIFLTMKLDRPVKIANVDFEPYLNVTSSHDGSFAFRAGVSPIVIVCMNTLRLAVAGKTHEYYIKHTDRYGDRLAQARHALQMSFEYYDGFEEEIQRLIDTEVTRRRANELLAEIFPDGESERQGVNATQRRETIQKVYQTDPAARPWQGTGWGLLNAVNVWELWQRPIRMTKAVSGDPMRARLERQAVGYLNGTDTPSTDALHKLLVKERELVRVR